jgi:acyl-coenzyme A synthetase/AMP-(fatty) acid ligase
MLPCGIPSSFAVALQGCFGECCRELDEQCKFRRPRSVDVVDEIPMTSPGKTDKKALRDPYWKEIGREVN